MLAIASITFLLNIFIPTAYAEMTKIEKAGQNIEVKEKKHGPYKDKSTYYENLDTISYDEQKEIEAEKDDKKDEFTLNPFTMVSNYFSEKKDDILGQSKDMMVSVLLMMVTMIFQFNIMMTNFLTTVLDAAMNASIINDLIDVTETQVQAVAGIENGDITQGKGIYGNLAGIAAIISALYICYLYLIKRAPIASLKALMHPILAITLSLLFFSNFAATLKGISSVSTELTNTVAAATREGDVDNISDSIQKVFIHRTWLYLQFDNGNEEKIGRKRVEALLLANSADKEKRKAIKAEVKDHKNPMMDPANVFKRLIYVSLFTVVNGLLSIPVWALAFLFLALQVWFLLMGAIAPFILIWSTLPSQFGVFARYSIEMMYPMALKVITGFIALIVFSFSALAYAIPATQGLTGYYLSVFFQFVFFFVIFLMKNRIKRIFSATRGFVAEMRNSTQLVTEPIKNTVQNTATVVGGVAGAATGSPQAAVAGASIGRNIGRTLTGNGDGLGITAQLVSLNQPDKQIKNTIESTEIQGKKTESIKPKTVLSPAVQTGEQEKVTQHVAPSGEQMQQTETTSSGISSVAKKEEKPKPSISLYEQLVDLNSFTPSTDSTDSEQKTEKKVVNDDIKRPSAPEKNKDKESIKQQSTINTSGIELYDWKDKQKPTTYKEIKSYRAEQEHLKTNNIQSTTKDKDQKLYVEIGKTQDEKSNE